MSSTRLFLVLLAAIFSLTAALDANATTACSTQIHDLLTSPRYADCQRDVAAYRGIDTLPAWVFTVSDKDAIHGSEVCFTLLYDLQNSIPSGACQTTIPGPQDGTTIHVTVARAALDQVAAACRRLRHLRSASAPLGAKPSMGDDASQHKVTHALV